MFMFSFIGVTDHIDGINPTVWYETFPLLSVVNSCHCNAVLVVLLAIALDIHLLVDELIIPVTTLVVCYICHETVCPFAAS